MMDQQDLSRLKIKKEKIFSKTYHRKKIYFFIFSIFSIIAIGYFYKDDFLIPPLKVQTVTVNLFRPSQALAILNANGYVVPQRKSAIASKITGRLVWIGVEEGSRVKKGEIIARLESDDVEAAKKQAEANVRLAQFNLELTKAELHEARLMLERSRALFEKGVIAKASYDSTITRYEKAVSSVNAAEASLEAAIAGLKIANTSVEYTMLRAPFDGIVLTKNADVGDIITPIGAAAEAKSAVVTIADINSFQIEADISETNISLINKGMPCEIELDGIPEKRFRGKIHMIVPTIERTKASLTVKIKLLDNDSRILPHMSAKIFFLSRHATPDEQKPTIMIHRSAIMDRNGYKAVFAIKNDRAKEMHVEIGKAIGEWFEIINGLKVGDKIIINPPSKLKDGRRIQYE
jgi:RND family efflux transporter MFP subunit